MLSDRPAKASPRAEATGLTLEDLFAVQPRHLRGKLDPGQRFPGGERAGRGRAQSLEFDGISPYQPGDDVRWIDWRATARSGRPQVKRFAAQSHRARMIVVDLRPDLYFGTHTRLMANTSVLLASWLGCEALNLQEPVGLVVPGFEIVEPRRGKPHLLRVLNELLTCHEAGRHLQSGPGLADAVADAGGLLHRGDEITVISDFAETDSAFSDISRTLAGIRTLRAYIVEDPVMRGPIPAGRYPVVVPGENRRTMLSISRRRGAAAAEIAGQVRAEIVRTLRDLGWQVADALSILPRP